MYSNLQKYLPKYYTVGKINFAYWPFPLHAFVRITTAKVSEPSFKLLAKTNTVPVRSSKENSCFEKVLIHLTPSLFRLRCVC